MPHLTLEYTENLGKSINFTSLFSDFHKILSDVGGININNCKSRAVPRREYFIGSGKENAAFVHLTVSFLEGRSNELKEKIGRHILKTLRDCYSQLMAVYDLQISVEFIDIPRSLYFKYPELKQESIR